MLHLFLFYMFQKENEKDDKFLKAPIKKVVNSEKITFDEEEWTNV